MLTQRGWKQNGGLPDDRGSRWEEGPERSNKTYNVAEK